jgi:phosphoribosylglycinamide formyltransferase-1
VKRIAIFGSGSGSNAEKILNYFYDHEDIEVGLVVSNKANAGILQHAFDYNIHTWVINKKAISTPTIMLEVLEAEKIDYIVLAGFLWLIPQYLIDKYNHKIINIHPSLLPKYGGKGMYGSKVHQEVFNNKETVSGITIHEVNTEYDKGSIVYQKQCDITKCSNPEDIAATVLKVEHTFYPTTIENWIKSKEL